MANELVVRSQSTGSTIYALAFNAAGQVVSGTSLVSFVVANWDDYDIALTETPASSYRYLGNMPAVAAGDYRIEYYEQLGASPAITDTPLGAEKLPWDGSALVAVSTYGKRITTALPNAASGATGGLATHDEVTAISTAATNLGIGQVVTSNIECYQNGIIGPHTIQAKTSQTGKSHSFVVYNPEDAGNSLWTLTTAGGKVTAGGRDVTITDDDTNTGNSGGFAYVLWNTTDDVVVAKGTLSILAVPSAP